MPNDSFRVLALDIGERRIGLALSDPLRLIAQPYGIIEANLGIKRSIRQVLGLVRSEGVRQVIIGLPRQMDGSLGEQAKKVQAFAERLGDALRSDAILKEVKITFWDERLTTVAADRVLCGSGLKNSEQHAAADKISASLILEAYLESERISKGEAFK